MTTDDLDDIYSIFSDPEVAKYDWFRPIVSKEAAMKFIMNYKEEFDKKKKSHGELN